MFALALVLSVPDPLPPGAVLRLGDARFRAPGEVRYLRFSADGGTLAGWAVGPNGGLEPVAWNTATGFPVVQAPDRSPPDAPDGAVAAVRLGPDRVLTAGPGNVGRVWDAPTARQLAHLAGHTGPVTSVAVSGDGKRLATGTADGFVRVWDAVTFRPLCEPRGHVAAVRTVRVSADGKRAITTGDDRAARVWDLTTGKELRAFPAAGPVELTPDGLGVVFPRRDSVVVRDILTGLEVVPGQLPARPTRTFLEWLARCRLCLAISPDGRTVAAAHPDGTIGLYEAATGDRRRELPGHGSPCHALVFTPDGERLLTAGADRCVLVWDVRLRSVPLPDAVKRETHAAKLWHTLTTGPADAAYLAAARLAVEPTTAVKMARLRLRPADAPDGGEVTDLADTRAVEFLEWLGTPEARRLLKELATGDAAAGRTREAARAANRLERK